MGNKLCGKKSSTIEDPTSAMFHPLQSFPNADSITIPSKCEAPSFTLSVQGSQKSDSSQQFKWSRMMNLIVEQQHFTEHDLTRASLKLTAQVMETVKRTLRSICDDVQAGVVTVPEPILEKFRPLIELKTSNIQVNTINNVTPLTKKVLTHLVAMVYFHDIILDDFRAGQNEKALKLLQQIAVSHALKGITPVDFRLLDWFLVFYLAKNQLVVEDGINNFVAYLNTVSNLIARFYKTQSIQGLTVEDMITEKPDNDRQNKHRENYRIMKKWAKQIEDFKEHEQFVELLIEQNRPDALRGKEESIDTLTLKEKDCIMKHFVKQRRSSINSERRSSKYSAFS